MLTDLQLSNSGNVEDVTALALDFRSFRRLRWKRISNFRTLAAQSTRALMLSGGMRSVLRYSCVARHFSAPPSGLLH